MDGSLASLKGNWWSSSHRRLGEEILIQAHRQLRAVKALDTSLQSFSDSWESKLKKAAAPSGQRPSHPVLPPRGRASLVEAQQVPPLPPPAPAVKEEEKESEDRSGGRGDSDRSESPDFGRTPSRSPKARPETPPRGRNSPPATEFAGAGHREWERAEHRQATRSPKPRRRTRPQHRGCAKHQRHYRAHHDRGTGSHQRHSGASYPSDYPGHLRF